MKFDPRVSRPDSRYPVAMADTSNNPTLPDVIRASLLSAVGDIETALPGRVTAYDHTQQRASVQPLIQGAYEDADGSLAYEELPVIHGVPVAFPAASGFSITWPLSVGDRVVLVFASRDIAGWLENDGDTNRPSDPRRHDLTDAIAIPGGRSFASPLVDVAAGTLLAEGKVIQLGATASDFVALASLVDAQLTALSNVFAAWVTVPNDGGAALKAALTALQAGGWPASVSASKVKAE